MEDKLILIYFFYGLAFFILGIVALMESKRPSQLEFAKALPYLSGFGILHALVEWMHLLEKIPPEYLGLSQATIPKIIFLKGVFLIASFLFLLIFGLILYQRHFNKKLITNIMGSIVLFYLSLLLYAYAFLPVEIFKDIALVLSKYLIGVPSSLLAGIGLWKEGQSIKELNPLKKSFKVMGLGFLVYGTLIFLFPKPAFFFPASHLNSEVFLKTTHVPVQFLRAIIAILIAIHSFRALSIFEIEQNHSLQKQIINLEILSSVDEVSGLNNHRYFKENLRKLIAMGKIDPNVHFSLLLIDIDYFKEFNDKYGHLEGDRLLNEIGRLLRSTIRTTDIVARYGGDELAIILQNSNLHEAFPVAEKIRRDVEGHSFLTCENKKITLSIGVANFPHCAQSVDGLIQVCDTALYRAKESRNKTECYSLF